METSRCTAKLLAPFLTVALAALVALGLTACTGGSEQGGLRLTEGSPRAVIGDYTIGGASQSGEGQGNLSIADGGCLRLDSGGGQEFLLIFPQGTELLSDGQPGVQIQGHRYLVGDGVIFGGGFRTLDNSERQSVAECQPNGEVFVIQTLSGT